MTIPLLILATVSSQIALADNLFKVFVREEGIYRISGSTLSDLGVTLEQIDPVTIRLLNNGGRELPEEINEDRPQGLNEVAIYLHGDEDGRFDEDDYLLFYGRNVHGLEVDGSTGSLSYHLHHYTDENVYWLALGGGPGKRMRQLELTLTGVASDTLRSFRSLAHFEEEAGNIWQAGKTWVWDFFTPNDPLSLTFQLQFLGYTC